MEFITELTMLLEEVDGDFIPPLSSSRNLGDYASKMYKNATTPFYKEMVLARAAGYIGYIKAKNKNLGFWLNYFYQLHY